MKTLSALVGRHIKMFFKDKGTFFTSLIAPLILLVLFVLFLGNVYRDSFYSSVPADIVVPDKVIEGFVGGWLLSSLLAVSCVTVAFCANMQIVQDKVTGAIGDFSVTPYKNPILRSRITWRPPPSPPPSVTWRSAQVLSILPA